MVGRQGFASQEDLNNVFSSVEDEIIQCDAVVAPSSQIWCDLSEVFPNSNPEAIYTAAIRWYNRKIAKSK